MSSTTRSAPIITPEIANHVLAHFGRGGYEAGSFTQQLIALIARADPSNTARLALGFPAYVAAVVGMQNDPDGAAWLTKLAAAEGPVGCRSCGGTAGPYDLTTGLCEDCLDGAK